MNNDYFMDIIYRQFNMSVSFHPIVSYSRETYNALTNWLTDARTLASPNIVIILCGNKKDLDADREVTFLEASRFAQENGNCIISLVKCASQVISSTG